ncbi:hypothetical protein WIS52_21880 [Pseudonocardia nematodicida]|uniref:Uncharacterized protein n=1 Tax=Pseudonocardia nematodicida TaxID=1206997 RepID=A0ABV1KF85_9PSEU
METDTTPRPALARAGPGALWVQRGGSTLFGLITVFGAGNGFVEPDVFDGLPTWHPVLWWTGLTAVALAVATAWVLCGRLPTESVPRSVVHQVSRSRRRAARGDLLAGRRLDEGARRAVEVAVTRWYVHVGQLPMLLAPVGSMVVLNTTRPLNGLLTAFVLAGVALIAGTLLRALWDLPLRSAAARAGALPEFRDSGS